MVAKVFLTVKIQRESTRAIEFVCRSKYTETVDSVKLKECTYVFVFFRTSQQNVPASCIKSNVVSVDFHMEKYLRTVC